MQLNLENEKAILAFGHVQAERDEEGRLIPLRGPTQPAKAVTTAWIRFDDGEVWMGNAWCSLQDQFCKERGRKLALARALQNSPDREWRKIVWEQYFLRV